MSADNYITISKSTFEVRERCASTDSKGYLIGKGRNLEEAISIAENYEQENIVEYGIDFIK